MPKQFTLSSVIPEPLAFTDTDGQRYEVLYATQFGLEQLARFERIEAEFHELMTAVREQTMDHESVGARLDAVLREMIGTVCPALPATRKQRLTLAESIAFINWWKGEQPAVAAPGGPKPGAQQTRARRSPGSSSRTASARPKRS